ncbi:hypothetical protein DFH08DRAFT_966540 [Mycena albidolilacea]|uniref:Fungal-type protein kinase domain-containing protein n=1 Tax=Mycena albidolilacea TaxID=1033008 RepID=A0AAD7ELK4_9AGAR|nr:hypothetical protein DFH08DRAFT_966540 [Mycena albidolilacea]
MPTFIIFISSSPGSPSISNFSAPPPDAYRSPFSASSVRRRTPSSPRSGGTQRLHHCLDTMRLSRDISPPAERAPKRPRTTPPEIQCASWTVELFSHGDLRTHVIGVLVTPNSIQMLYYDRSIVVKSEPLFFTTSPAPFITMLSRIASLTRAQWGYSVALKEAPTPSVSLSDGISDRTFVGKTLQFTNGWMLEFGVENTTYQEYDVSVVFYKLVVASQDGQNVGKLVIVKWSWSPQTRTREASIIEAATTRATEAGDTWVLDHLPVTKYELRDLRITVQEELTPIEGLKTAPELAEATRGIFECYRWLFEIGKVMHRDISLGNLMYRTKNGKIFGVLNDFDLSLLTDETTL